MTLRLPASSRVALVILGALALFGCESGPDASDFRVGMSRHEIIAQFGEPHGRQSFVKSSPRIWGPIETFWATVPQGVRVEIWSYPVAEGTVELYFVEGSPDVQGIGFGPTGAVY